MKVSGLAADASLRFVRASLDGFGLSAGSAAYRYKDNVLPAVVLGGACAGALVLPFMAGQRFTRWSPESWTRYGLRAIGWSLLAVLGCVIFFVVGFIGFAAVHMLSGTEPKAIGDRATSWAITATATLAALGFVAGFLRGLIQRGTRKRAFAVLCHNQAFLDAAGIRDLGGKNVTHIDGDDNKLTLDHIGERVIEFTVPGSSRKRAHIHIGADGRFESYTGIVES